MEVKKGLLMEAKNVQKAALIAEFAQNASRAIDMTALEATGGPVEFILVVAERNSGAVTLASNGSRAGTILALGKMLKRIKTEGPGDHAETQ